MPSLSLFAQRHRLCRYRAHVLSYAVQDEPDAEERADSALLASAMAMSDGAVTAKQEEAASRAAKHLSLRRETVLQWLHQTTGAGGQTAWSVLSSVGRKVYCRRDNRRGSPEDRYVLRRHFFFYSVTNEQDRIDTSLCGEILQNGHHDNNLLCTATAVAYALGLARSTHHA